MNERLSPAEQLSSSTPYGVGGDLGRFSTPHYIRGYPHYTPSDVFFHRFCNRNLITY